MHLHYLQHVDFEDLGNIESWAREHGCAVTRTRLHERERLPNPAALDWLVVMGGPMSVQEENRFPWLSREKVFIKRCIELGKRVLGVCLGAQLIAEVLGGHVSPNAHKEIGWFPVRRTSDSEGSALFSSLPQCFHAFHWHGDTFSIPEGAVRLAESDGCANQAFSYGDTVLALQFHIESNAQGVSKLLRHCSGDLQAGPYVQSEQAIRAGFEEHLPALDPLLSEVLGRMAQPA